MKKRNPLLVVLFGVLTGGFFPIFWALKTKVFYVAMASGGLYSWYWAVKTKGEMNKLGEKIPTAWVWLIPIVGTFWWYWKYSEGVERITKNELNTFTSLIALLLLGPFGQAIVQEAFNRSGEAVTATPTPSSVYQPGTSVLPPIPPINNPTATETTTTPPNTV